MSKTKGGIVNLIKILKCLLSNIINKPNAVKLPEHKRPFVRLYNAVGVLNPPGSIGHEFEKMAILKNK